MEARKKYHKIEEDGQFFSARDSDVFWAMEMKSQQLLSCTSIILLSHQLSCSAVTQKNLVDLLNRLKSKSPLF